MHSFRGGRGVAELGERVPRRRRTQLVPRQRPLRVFIRCSLQRVTACFCVRAALGVHEREQQGALVERGEQLQPREVAALRVPRAPRRVRGRASLCERGVQDVRVERERAGECRRRVAGAQCVGDRSDYCGRLREA